MYAIWVHSCYILQTILNNDRSQIKYWYWNITLSQNVIMNIHFTHFILPVNVQAVNPTSYELHGPFNFTYDRQHKPVFSLRSHQIIHVDTQNTTVDSGASTPLYSWGGESWGRGIKHFTTTTLNFPVTFDYLIGKSWLFWHIVTFVITAPYKYSYLLADQFLVDNYLWQFYGITSKPRRMLLRWKFTKLQN